MDNQQFTNPNPVNIQSAPPIEPPKAKKWPIILIVVIVALIFLAAGAIAGYFLAGNTTVFELDLFKQQPAVDVIVTSTVDQTVLGEVTWQEPKAIASLNLNVPPVPDSGFDNQAKYYQVGKINSGKYQGSDLILASITGMGPAVYSSYFRFAKSDSGLVLIQKNSDALGEEYQIDETKFTVDKDYQISQLIYPDVLTGPKGEKLERDQYARYFFSLNNLKLAYTDKTYGDVYTTAVPQAAPTNVLDQNGFYLKAPDGTVVAYKMKDTLLGDDSIPAVTWSDGKKNTQAYTDTDIGGCGSRNYISVINPNAYEPNSFATVGKTATGDDILALIDTENYLYKNMYNTSYQVMPGQKKLTYKEFLAAHPIFFWRDSFGRLIKFSSTKFQPLAECGKPVIYLYPKEETQVSVKLEPQGGFSYTEPVYNNGWSVIARPDGHLTEISSGQDYPYLFWEGRGGIYQTPERGFVVKRQEVKALLVDKLTQFNLNQKEISDFLDFWLPRMQEKPYYFITFLGTADMDRLAPLSISPQPDTVIRVLMDFTPLDHPVTALGYEIKPLPRNGFTVIEWGGVLRK